MKSSSRSIRSGFTLVELLVVIAIIAILASVLLGVGATVINMAKRTKAANTATQIQTACLSYYTEYSVYPLPGTITQATPADAFISDTDATDWKPLIEGLCGNISPSNPSAGTITTTGLNTRAIAFLTLKSSDVDSNDCPLNTITPNTTNKYFNLAMDTDYDGLLGTSVSTTYKKLVNISASTTATTDMTGTSTAGIAVWANCNPPNYNNPKYFISTY